MNATDPIRSIELQKFSDNAAEILIHQGNVKEFFDSIGYNTKPHQNGYRGMCPACVSSYCFIGLNGNAHRIYWRCYDSRCPSHVAGSGYRRNLLGLVRAFTMPDENLGEAIKTIAAFLGFEGRSFDITNGRYSLGPSREPREGD